MAFKYCCAFFIIWIHHINGSNDGEWTQWSGFYYFISSTQLDPTDARSYCQELHGDLLSVTSEDENRFITSEVNAIESAAHVIGLYTSDPCSRTNRACRGQWQWRDGSNTDYQIQSWYDGRPDNADDRCAVLFPFDQLSKWSNIGCNIAHNRFICKKQDPCMNANCGNRGTCEVIHNGNRASRCECDTGFTGDACEINIDDCDPLPCDHGGSCTDLVNGFTCSCPINWTGSHCEIDVNECEIDADLCQNGGTCLNNNGGFSCECAYGYTGWMCESDIDECSLGYCQHDATCENLDGTFSCQCTSGWSGNLCDSDINECLGIPCNNGACRNTDGNFICECIGGWTGSVCDTDIDECVDATLCNNGTCENSDGGFMCDCDTGFNGTFCDIDINECLLPEIYCINGTCDNFIGSYFCNCTDGFEGEKCDIVTGAIGDGNNKKNKGDNDTVMLNVFYGALSFAVVTGLIMVALIVNDVYQERRIRKRKRTQRQPISKLTEDNEDPTAQMDECGPPAIANTAFEANEDDQASAVGVENINVDIASLYAKPMKNK